MFKPKLFQGYLVRGRFYIFVGVKILKNIDYERWIYFDVRQTSVVVDGCGAIWLQTQFDDGTIMEADINEISNEARRDIIRKVWGIYGK